MREVSEVKPPPVVLWFRCPRDGTAVRLATHNVNDPIWRGVAKNGLACPICSDDMERMQGESWS